MNMTDAHNALSSLYSSAELLSYYTPERLRQPVMRDQLQLYLFTATGAYNSLRGQLNALQQVLTEAHARLYAAQYEQVQPSAPQHPMREAGGRAPAGHRQSRAPER